MRRHRHLAAVFVALLTVSSAGSAQDTREQFSAVLSNISNAGGTGITPLTIRIVRWTPDEEHNRLMETLRNKGQDAFLRALTDVDAVGSIQAPTSLKYDFFYARQQQTKDGGRQIMMITDRPMDIAERWTGARTRDYPFSVIQMNLDKDGKGQGTLAQLVQLRLSGEFLAIENLATGPMKLTDIKKLK
jgi:hypothetical protein